MSAEQPTVLPWHKAAADEILAAQAYGKCLQTAAAIIARHDPQGVWIAYDAWVKELEARLTAAKKRAELLQDHYECKMDTPQRVSRMETQHAATLRLLERALSHTMSTETGRIIVQDAIRAHLAAMKGTQ